MKQVSSNLDAAVVFAPDRLAERDRVIERLRLENRRLKGLVVSLSQTILRNVVAGGPDGPHSAMS
ncbi:hypothetical protein SR870_00485 [Rhodopseudomonas palustris]|uniref:hypothetical protein n=1 Tax=Rhodopseudomonas palustris TaxID=1076 RepID=UPI002ACEC469|nr:hypothetical protein [Rhodopseudomonas palustris]WQG99805.1 hypothetical protein SR870_00485 [Rhodopseudomonas palustris]